MKTAKASKLILTAAVLSALFAGCERRDNTTTGAASPADAPPPPPTAEATTQPASPPSAAATPEPSPPPSAEAPATPTEPANPPSASAEGQSSSGASAGGSSASSSDAAGVSPQTSDSSGASTERGASASGAAAESNDMKAQEMGDKAGNAVTTAANAVDDTVITGKVKAALLADEKVKGLDINVETKANEVLLSGYVEDQSQIESAVNIAQNIEGVKKVNNKLEVQKEEAK